jgi:hypothetical protein
MQAPTLKQADVRVIGGEPASSSMALLVAEPQRMTAG